MRIVIALGGNALLRRGEELTVKNQRENVRAAARALAPLIEDHELVISHGNGPQVGLLALQASSYDALEPVPLDVLGAETEGMIGYMIEQELGNLVPFEKPFATMLTMVEVDPADPAFDEPTKPIGPVYTEEQARTIASERGWHIGRDGDHWRRMVPSPHPKRIFEIRPIRWLLERGTVVICAGGGGIPTMYNEEGRLMGAEVVIDKDLASSVLAREVGADMLVMATDVEAVYVNWKEPDARALRRITPEVLRGYDFATGSMGPKVEAAMTFVEETGGTAAIGSLGDLGNIVAGKAGTIITSG